MVQDDARNRERDRERERERERNRKRERDRERELTYFELTSMNELPLRLGSLMLDGVCCWTPSPPVQNNCLFWVGLVSSAAIHPDAS